MASPCEFRGVPVKHFANLGFELAPVRRQSACSQRYKSSSRDAQPRDGRCSYLRSVPRIPVRASAGASRPGWVAAI